MNARDYWASVLSKSGRRMLEPELLAEGVGFEPTIRFPVYTLSKRAPSATRPSLRIESRLGWRNITTACRVTTRSRAGVSRGRIRSVCLDRRHPGGPASEAAARPAPAPRRRDLTSG